MTIAEWMAVIGVSAAWAGLIVTITIHLHNSRKAHAESTERRIMAAVDAQAAANARAHGLLSEQVKDMADQIRANYVDRREFDVTARTFTAGMVQLGKEMGDVGNRVSDVGKRVDQILHYAQWRPPREDD